MKKIDELKNKYSVGFTADDIGQARKLNAISIILSQKGKFLEDTCPDYYIESISELPPIDSRYADKIIFEEINVLKCPKYHQLNVRERLFLQNHFRRIQQHSLIVGKLMYLQAKILKENTVDWETAGILHDIDYARTYYNMSKHGFLAPKILQPYGVNKEIIKAIRYHGTSKFWKTKFLLGWALHISEMFTKRFVHAIRKYGYIKIEDMDFNNFMVVYDSFDFRKNERLTRLEELSMRFNDFKEMMRIYDRDIDGFPLTRRQFFSLTKKSFMSLNIFPLAITHEEELKNLKLIED